MIPPVLFWEWVGSIMNRRMGRRFLFPVLWLVGSLFGVVASHAAPPAVQDWQGLPEGPGREDVFYTCGACHSLMMVKQQRLPRHEWEKTLAWMVAEKGMADPDPATKGRLLDYLSTHYGYKPGSQSPALGPLPPLTVPK